MSKKRITTVEELAHLSQQEFLRLDKQIDAGFERMDAKMDAGFERMDAGFKSIVELMRMEREHHDTKDAALEKRVTRLEQKVFMK